MKMFLRLVGEMFGALFGKHSERHLNNGVTQFGGREEWRSFRKNVLKRTFVRFAFERHGALFDNRGVFISAVERSCVLFAKCLLDKKYVF